MPVVAVASLLLALLLPLACSYNYVDGEIADRLNRSSVHILHQLLLKFTDGPFPWKVAQYNAKQFFPRYNRYYWIGKRYYKFDPDGQLPDRLPCEYPIPLNATVLYEDDEPVQEVVFQCRKFQQACCGEMDCCLVDERGQSYTRFPNE
uniref:CX domain-containing protein n=1 Tax=Trichuris muris TaxID=70415 RepID=A0A5S6R4D4_TRIMR